MCSVGCWNGCCNHLMLVLIAHHVVATVCFVFRMKTSAPIGELKCEIPPFKENMTDWPTNQPGEIRGYREVTLPINPFFVILFHHSTKSLLILAWHVFLPFHVFDFISYFFLFFTSKFLTILMAIWIITAADVALSCRYDGVKEEVTYRDAPTRHRQETFCNQDISDVSTVHYQKCNLTNNYDALPCFEVLPLLVQLRSSLSRGNISKHLSRFFLRDN